MAAGEQLIDGATVDRIRRGWTSNADSDPRLRLLSPQERRVLDHVAQGLTNRQIGEAMSLAEKTVKNYITAVLGKLGMERRTQAAVFAVTPALSVDRQRAEPIHRTGRVGYPRVSLTSSSRDVEHAPRLAP